MHGANVFVVPVWDIPSRWCPEEIKRNTASASASAPAVASVASTELHQESRGDADCDEPAADDDGLRAKGDDEESGSDSDQSEIGWDGALGSESRLWSRAAVDSALVLLRRVQAAAPKTGGEDGEGTTEQVYGIGLSSAMFSTSAITDGSDALLDRRLADVLRDREPKWCVCALRQGHFAGAVFNGTEPVVHKAIHRYTIRAKSGGSQAAQDSSKKTKSAGSTLRRYGAQRLGEEIQELLTDKWSAELAACDIIFVSVSKRMRATLLGTESKPYVPMSKVRRLPFMVGKPTFEAIKEAHFRVAGVVFADEPTMELLEKPFRPAPKLADVAEAPVFTPPTRDVAAVQAKEEVPKVQYKEEDDELYSPLHSAAAANNEDLVMELLEDGANPTARDGKGRVPYYLCATQRAREAFRRYRGQHEDEFDWGAAQVPEGITEDSEQRKKDKEKEKKKKLKEKQKTQKSKAKEEEEAQKKKEEDDARAMAAAQTKCDCCKAPITTGKPFSRLTYLYCSTECVNTHRRDLQAEAAMKRFNK